MLFINQNITISGFSFIHIYHRLVCILHRSLLNEWVDVLLSSELQHTRDVLRGPDAGSAHLASLSNEGKRAECWNLVLRSSHLNELPVRSQELEVLCKRHIWARNG